jgi:hypothetical protein
VLLLCLFHCHDVNSSKLRPWLDSSITLLEGSLPSPRGSYGFTATDDGRIYMFGGVGPSGDPLPIDVVLFTDLLVCLSVMLARRYATDAQSVRALYSSPQAQSRAF